MSLADLTIREFIDALASDAPVPGGGASAAANVNVNLPLVKDAAWEAAATKRVEMLTAGTALLAGSTRYAVAAGVPRRPLDAAGEPRAALEAAG